MDQEPNPAPPPPDEPEDPPATGTGLYYRDGTEIPPTHPDHGPMDLIPRQEDGSIAAYYYCSKAELYDMQVDRPPPRRHRRDGFTAERQEQFLEFVRGGASGREAARKVGISPTTAYNLYNSPDGAAFRAGWDEAAKVTDIVLEDTAFDRAVNGQEEIVFHKGERVGTRWKYDNNLLMKLLRARQPLKYAPLSEIEGWLRHRGIAPPADVDGALGRLRDAEAEWSRRLPGEEAPARLADESGSRPRSARLDPPPSARAEPPPSVRPEPVEGLSSPVEAGPEDGPPTGPGRAEEGADFPSSASTSSTSPGSGQSEAVPAPLPGEGRGPVPPPSEVEDAAHTSTSSTSSGTGQAEAAPAPLPGEGRGPGSPSGEVEDAAHAPTSSTSPGSGQAEAAPDDGSIVYYRPPPRPRLRSL